MDNQSDQKAIDLLLEQLKTKDLQIVFLQSLITKDT